MPIPFALRQATGELRRELPDDEVELRPIREDDSPEKLTDLLHRAYRPLGEQGLRFLAVHQTVDDTLDRLRDAYSWVGVVRGEPVATISLYDRADGEDVCAWYRRDGVWHFGQFAVEPHLQRFGLGSALIDLVEAFARSNGAVEMALDTAEGASHLIAYYERRGYRHVDTVRWSVTNYRSVVMARRLV